MPSLPHEIPLEMCRWRGALAHELLRGRTELPSGELVEQHASADLSQITPVEYRADHVVTFHRPEDRAKNEPVLAVIIESQLDSKPPKRYSWPAYVGMAHQKWACDVVLLVLTKNREVARWAKGPFGPPKMRLYPVVVDLSELPRELSHADALRMPELAVLSAIGHRTKETAKIALEAIKQLPAEKAELCFDAVMLELPEAAREALKEDLKMIEDYEFGSDIALRYFARAKQEGLEAGLREGREKGLEEGKKEGLEQGKKKGIKEGKQKAKRESVAMLQRIALQLLTSKVPKPSAMEKAIVTGLSNDARLATLIAELGCAGNAKQAKAALVRMRATQDVS